ncbi:MULTISPECIES: DUF5996 family protein [Salimicrobium]|uniref:Suppressor of fused protein (SUFU) n=1 Tax=Salimicrobium humidisoli TaxID=2029857 RepID=A0ABX4HS52_9BACI|nr:MULTISPECIES: DUF5996 family protein [Salimicrobium]PBB05530.1 hypothetical protein CKW00_08050 [Salimicrobium humidisoli]
MLYKDWAEEKTTLHLLSQILGKYQLELEHKAPQWEHVILDITTQGVSTGLLSCDGKAFSIALNLVHHRLEIVTKEKEEFIDLKNGRTVKDYYLTLKQILENEGIDIPINTVPQEMESTIPFEEDTEHHHYSEQVSEQALGYFQFAYEVEKSFLNPFRARRIKPGLFWGTFDVSGALVYNRHEPFEDDSKVIERAAFDEHMIEFGFWLGDDTFKGPTFFVLAYPFPTSAFECGPSFPESSYFDTEMGEFILQLENGGGAPTAADITTFFDESYHLLKDYLEWENCDHYHIGLKMRENFKDAGR